MKKKYLYSVFAVFMMFSLLLIGCSNNTATNNDSTEKPKDSEPKEQEVVEKKNKDIIIAVADNFISMDPHDTNDTLSYSAQKTMLEGLVGFDKDMNVIPVLAEKFESNDEATEFTFTLRQGVSFHDGEPFNAEAVKVNVDRLANPDNNLKRHSLFAIVKETQVVNEYTVKVVLSEPFGAMINNFAHPAAMMISPKALETYGKEVSQNPVGTGQYIFDEWVPGDYLKVKKNENYWKSEFPKLDSITFKPTPENGTRVAMLQTGEADFIYPVPSEQAESINGKDGIVVENAPSIIVRYLAMNTLKEPYNDVRVRQAINYAVNKDAFIKVVMNGYATKLDSIIAPNTQFYSQQEVYEFNVEKAKELLKEAGYENGFEATVWGSNNSSSIKGMEFLQQQLAQINVKLEVVPMESGTMSEKIWSVVNPEDAELELYYGGWSPSTGDADWGIRPLVGGKDAYPPKSYNTAYFDNAEVNSLISAALATADSEKRKDAYEKVQKLIWDEAPWTFLSVDDTMAGKKNYLEGIYLLPDGSLSVENVEIKE
ncbi:glutathione ABC transporter substrate-binding protein [Cytobacillus sp. S13-E01]|uniref:glutathione ABC transporter substrate-binding protein n=1 Tax=Cytobacillus sp. S13-E01 TaxID=3031326 RepID=UPI0023D7E4B5|nr:glutathione ABC transporter substrate-binding protein [Cytobacillus sp. S13-E01]MDF0726533.1 glutathione ABC transporter substrate-binding protein [Cytobacillus sp. S13-E01]